MTRIIIAFAVFACLTSPAFAQEEKAHQPSDWMVIHARHTAKEQQSTIAISGRTSYPDGVLIHIALAFRETRLEWTRAEVSRGSFTVEWQPRKKLFPGYFVVEAIFYPDRQPAHLSGRMKNQKMSVSTYPVRVGTPEAIRKYRETRLTQHEDYLQKLRTLYSDIKKEYLKQVSDTSRIDTRAWHSRAERWRQTLSSERAAFLAHRQEWMAERFPDIQEAFMGAVELLRQFLDAATSFIFDPSQRIDPHLARPISPLSMVDDFDSEMDLLFENIRKSIDARRTGENEELLKHLTLECFRCFQSLNAFHDSLSSSRQPGKPAERWNAFVSAWDKDFQALVEELQKFAESPLNDAQKNLANRTLVLADQLKSLMSLYQERVSQGSSDSTPDIEALRKKFLDAYIELMRDLRTPDILGETFAALGERVPKSPNEITPEIHSTIMESIAALSSDSPEERVRALSFLVTLGQIVKPYFEERLNSEDKRLATLCLIGLGWLGEKESLPRLLEILSQEEDPEITRSVAEAIGYLGDPGAVPALLEKLSTAADPVTRTELIETVTRLSDARSVDALIDFLRDENPEVRAAANRAMERFVGMSLPLHDKQSPAERAGIVEKFRQWWQENRNRYMEEVPRAPEEPQ